jgi:hypothetical protein
VKNKLGKISIFLGNNIISVEACTTTTATTKVIEIESEELKKKKK